MDLEFIAHNLIHQAVEYEKQENRRGLLDVTRKIISANKKVTKDNIEAYILFIKKYTNDSIETQADIIELNKTYVLVNQLLHPRIYLKRKDRPRRVKWKVSGKTKRKNLINHYFQITKQYEQMNKYLERLNELRRAAEEELSNHEQDLKAIFKLQKSLKKQDIAGLSKIAQEQYEGMQYHQQHDIQNYLREMAEKQLLKSRVSSS